MRSRVGVEVKPEHGRVTCLRNQYHYTTAIDAGTLPSPISRVWAA